MTDITALTDTALRAAQQTALDNVRSLCAEAAGVSRTMSDQPGHPAYGDLYEQWRDLITRAQNWGNLIPRITVELERRAQKALADA